MRKFLFLIASIITFQVSIAQTSTFSGTGGAISSKAGVVVDSFPITVSNVGAINGTTFGLTSVSLNLTMNRDSIQEIYIKNSASATDSVFLYLRPIDRTVNGVLKNNNFNATFINTSLNPIWTSLPPFNGKLLPDGMLGLLNDGRVADGTWQLYVKTNNPSSGGVSGGMVNSWSLTFSNKPAENISINKTASLPSKLCNDAPLICDFNGFLGKTNSGMDISPILKDKIENDTKCGGIIHNNSFIKFIAGSTTVSFDLYVYNSRYNKEGMQMWIVDGSAVCGTSGSVKMYPDISGGTCSIGLDGVNVGYVTPTTYKAKNLTIGNTYYIVFDGATDDYCDFIIKPSAGSNSVQSSISLTPQNAVVCLGQSVTLNATSNGSSAPTWATIPSSALSSLSGNTVTFNSSTSTPASTTPYTVTVSGGTTGTCPASAQSKITVVETPSFTAQPSTTSYTILSSSGKTFSPLSVTVSPSTGIFYQWYSNANASNSGGVAISGATSSTYTPPNTTGTYYYYCVITNNACTEVSNLSGAYIVNLPPTSTCTANPDAIEFIQQPSDVAQSVAMTPAVTVRAFCKSTGETYTGSTPITITAINGCGFVTLTQNTSSGIAIFTGIKDVIFTRSVQTGVSLVAKATATTADSIISNTFNVTAPAATTKTETKLGQWQTIVSEDFSAAGGTWYKGTKTKLTQPVITKGTDGIDKVVYYSNSTTPRPFYALTRTCSTDNSGTSNENPSTATFANIPNLATYDSIDFTFNIGAVDDKGNTKPDKINYNGMWSADEMIVYLKINKGAWDQVLYRTGKADASQSQLLGLTDIDPSDTLITSTTANKIDIGTKANSYFRAKLNSLYSQGKNAITDFQFKVVWQNNRTYKNWIITNLNLIGKTKETTTTTTIPAATPSPLPTVSVAGSATICPGNFANLTSTPSNVVGTTVYAWSPKDSLPLLSATLQNPQTINLKHAQSYSLTITDADGCTATAGPVNISMFSQPILNSQPTPQQVDVCLNGTVSPLTIDAINTESYHWYVNSTNSTTGGTDADNGSSSTFTPPTDVAGTFYYYCVIGSNCSSLKVTSKVFGPYVVKALPTVTTNSLSLTCSVTSVDLSTAITSSTPTIGTVTPFAVTYLDVAKNLLTTSTVNAPGTYYVTYKYSAQGCADTTAITVTQSGTAGNTITLSSATSSDAQTVCSKTAITNITYSTTGATGATFTGLPTGVTGVYNAGNITISGTPTVAGTYSYTVTTTGGCGLSATGSITVTKANTFGTPSSTPTLCVNTALTDITIATTGASGIGTATGLPAGVTASWAANTITISGTPTESGTFNYTVPLTGGSCGNVSATGTLTVTAANSYGTPSSTPTLCVNTALTNITITTNGATGIGAATGLPAGVTASWAANIISITGTPTASGTFNYTIPLSGGCKNVSATGTITVLASNSYGTPSSTPTLCVNTALTDITISTTGASGIGSATGLPAGVTASWAANTITISGKPTTSGTFNYTVPLLGGSCGNVYATGTLTVTAANSYGAPSSSPTLNVNTSLTPITITTIGATGIGTPTGLPNGVSATWLSGVITISGIPTSTGTFNYSIPLNGGCESVNAIGSIVVNSANDNTVVGPSSNPTVCVNSALTNITFTTSVATGIGTPVGLPNGVTAAWASNQITISGTPTQSGVFNYSILLTGGIGTVTARGTITVNPFSTATISGNAAICKDASPAPVITFTGSGGTSPYTFTYNINGGSSLTVTGVGNTATINAPTSVQGSFAYNLVSVIDASTNACSQSQTGTATVTVNASPSLSITNPTIACNATTADLTDASVTVGSTAGLAYTYWTDANATLPYATPTAATSGSYYIKGTNSATGCFDIQPVTVSASSLTLKITNPAPVCSPSTVNLQDVNIIAGSSSGISCSFYIDATATIPCSTPKAITASGTYYIKATTTGGCSDIKPVIVTINPLPTAAIVGTASVCIGGISPVITFTGGAGTSPYTFTYNVNGGSSSTITSVGNTATINAPTTASGSFAYNVVSVEDASTTTCSQAQTGTATVTVNPLPTATITGNATVCFGGTAPVITFTGATGTSPYTFTYNINGGPSLTVSSVGNKATINAPTTASGSFIYNLVSVVDASANACSQLQTGTATVTVNSASSATIAGSTTVCNGATSPVVTFTGSGGTSPYTFTYNINGGSNHTVTSTGDVATINAPTSVSGSFAYNLVSVVDASINACPQLQTGAATVKISAAPAAPSVQATNPTCSVATGSVKITSATTALTFSTDGTTYATYTTPYTFAAGASFSITAKNADGCYSTPVTGKIDVQPATPVAFDVSGTGSFCPNGVGVPVALSGSEPDVNYQLQIAGVNTGTPLAGTGAGLTFPKQTIAGTYTVFATNATSGCTANMKGSAIITKSIAKTLSVTIAATKTSICLGGDVTLAASAANAGTDATYKWKINGVVVETTDLGTFYTTTDVLKNNDTISCVLFSNIGCLVSDSAISNKIGFKVIEPPIVQTITSSAKDSVCQNATITLSNATTGGTWSSDNKNIATVNTGGLVTGVKAGIDSIRYTVRNACFATTKSLGVKVVALTKVAAILGDSVICKGATVQLTTKSTGGTWSVADKTIDTVDTHGEVAGLQFGKDVVSYTLAGYCNTDVANYSVKVIGKKLDSKDINMVAPTCLSPFGGKINMDISGSESPYTFKFKGSTYPSTSIVTNVGEGIYNIYFYNYNSCLVDSFPHVVVISSGNCDTLYVPTGFLPGRQTLSGKDNLLKPFGGSLETISSLLFRVYNRLGNLVFVSHDLYSGWDGTYKGVAQGTGTYVWYLDYSLTNGKPPIHLQGTSVLIR